MSRSEEAKQLGIRMGVPAFQISNLIKKHDIAVLSSNYTLYGDMSQRVMDTLSRFTPSMEIYSIDEAFLCLDDFSTKDLTKYAREIRKKVYQCTGIPVSIGIGPTKTLAKAANKCDFPHWGRKTPSF